MPPYSPEAPRPPVQQHSVSAWGARKALLVTEAGLGREALLCMRAKQNKPVVSTERKGKRARACPSQALVNARSHWNNDQSWHACCI